MLTWRMLKKEKLLSILFFPNGTIQCVGSCGDDETNQVLQQLQSIINVQLPPWTTRTMTVLYDLNMNCDFRRLTSSANVTYEVELFPAAQVNFLKPYHVHVFHNGKVIITGIRSLECVSDIINRIVHFLQSTTAV